MTIQLAYWWLLGALTFIVTVKGSQPMLRTACAILLSGLCSLIIHEYFFQFQTPEYALAMMAIDGVAAALVLLNPAGKAQSLIGWTFLFQIMVYGGRLTAEGAGYLIDLNAFWWGLAIPALIQLALVGGWWLHDRVPRRHPVRPARPAPAAAHRQGLD